MESLYKHANKKPNEVCEYESFSVEKAAGI
jgi:hypothetical protein